VDEQRRIEIGERIRRFRGQMRQHQAAERLHVSVRTYQGWELGETATDLENYEAVAQLFGVSLRDILGDESGAPAWAQEIRSEILALRADVAKLLEVAGSLEMARAADDLREAEGQVPARNGEGKGARDETG
jgi:transcriptional regulator with XRE-family HTH domain